MLDVGAEQGFGVAVRILAHGLELINRNNAWFIGRLNVLKDLFERHSGCMDITHLYIPRRITHVIEGYATA